jgi:cobalt-zinc-cadmium efflux system membrane fusion protein
MTTRKITGFIIIIILFVITALPSCSTKPETAEAAPEEEAARDEVREVQLSKEQFDNSHIKTGAIENRNLNAILKVSGKLDVPPQNLVSVSAPIGGFLISTEMLEGKHVVKGEVVAVIEHPEIAQLQQNFIEAKSKYDLLEQELERQQELNKQNVNSAKVLQQTQSDFNIAQAQYRSLEEKIRMAGINKANVLKGNISGMLTVVSPITGFVTKVNVNVGKMVNQQDVMFEIVDTEHLHAELTVFEKDITKIKVGQKVRFTLADNPAQELSATVHLIGRSFDDSRSVRIHCHLDAENTDLLPGMFINAVIELEGMRVNSVPADAIVKENGKDFIFIKNDVSGCGKHEMCTEHEGCPVEEACPEHPICEQHEACKDKTNCEHKECIEHDKKEIKTNILAYNFTKIEVKAGISDGKYTQIQTMENVEANSSVVVAGAFFLLSQSKMGGEMDACGQ